MTERSKKTMNVKFSKSPEYKIVGATGAYGGPTPQGEILCHLFIEYPLPPERVEIEVNPDGSFQERVQEPKDVIVRELQVGLLLRPDIARIIGKWLVDHAEKVMGSAPHLAS